MKEFIIKEDLANTILQYLASRPYGEVYQLVLGIQSLKEVETTQEQQEL